MKWRWFILLAVLLAIVAVFVPPLLVGAIVFAILAVFFLARNLAFGLILLVFFFPYLGLVIDFGSFDVFREVPYLKNVNAPFIDLYGLLLFGAWGLSVLINLKSEIRMTNQAQMSKFKNSSLAIRASSLFPHWKPYLLFWLSGLVSLFKVPAVHFEVSVKYFLRPFTFFYLVFFTVPVSIMQNAKLKMQNDKSGNNNSTFHILHSTFLHRVLLVFFWTGLLSALNGLLGLLFGVHEGFPRATPFGFFGINPLGPNHNLLAETLIATAPAGLILGIMNYELRIRKLIWWGMGFQWTIALLTFARSAWVAVAAQGIIYLWLTRRGRLKDFLKKTAPALALLAVLAALLLATTFTETVRGSTLSRLDMARISAFYFWKTPWIGQGLGTFLPTLWATKAFLLEYGDPLEAHGIIFKLMLEQGLLGIATFAIFAGVILVSLYRTYQTNRTYGMALLAALLIAAGSLTYQLFNTTYYTSKLWVPLAIAVAIARIMNHESRIKDQKYRFHDS